ncbi:MAG: diguanylate cyclase [Candidatus Sabulitectum sp.]|nr:diguanylate cyclase [Candidatus Sabulitectum sp.]
MRNKLSKADVKNLFILRRVSPDAVMDVLGSCPVVPLKRGQILLRAGQSNQNLYLILSGKLTVFLEYPGSDPVAVLDQGETVGELSVIDDSPTSAYVVAVEESRVLELDETAFWRMISESHAFACNMLLLLSDRMRSSDEALLKNIHLRKRFQRDAMVDSLTGMHNRRWLDIQLPRLIDRHVRSERPLCVIMYDVDNFKKFNDSYGHDAGDDVLAQVARSTLLGLRPTDLSARFGGEEFVIMLASINIDLAWIVAERLRKNIASERVVTDDGRELPPITISLGIAQSRTGDTADSLLKRADTAMYKAKETGRNRSCREEQP